MLMKIFTWKKWVTYTLIFFIISILVSCIWNYFDNEESVSNVFITRELVKSTVLSVLAGFFFAMWAVYKSKE
jgi:hypothetical protein